MITIRCSKLARPMVCAGYPFLKTPDFPKGTEGDEGTAAGEYLEKLLTNQPLTEVAENGVYFDDDMKFFITPIYEEMKARAASIIGCEKRIDWTTRSGISIRGQFDASYIDHRGYLCIDDLKYGWGIHEVFEHWQLLGYAIGDVIRRNQAFEYVSLRIHQPRPHHEDGPVREWLISYQELMGYKERIEVRMLEVANGNRTLQTSDQCKYCDGTAESCPAFNRLFYRALEVSTNFSQDSITDEELSRQLDQVKRAEETIKIKKDSIVELGTLRIRAGHIIPNYVQTKKFGTRKWKRGVTPKSIEAMTGIRIIEEKVMTPAKAEKLGVDKKLVKQLVEAPFIGVKLEKKDTTELGNKIFGSEKPERR